MRVRQKAGTKGSLKWMQRAVAERPDLIQPPDLVPIDWLSPRADDDFAEYRDGAFLDLLGLGRHRAALADFWPRGGPQWDALGRAGEAVVLVEAKAHLNEFRSPPTQAGPESRARIEYALLAARRGLGADEGAVWSATYYQYANRLAHLWFLDSLGVAAHLLFIGFTGDGDVGGPHDSADWLAAYAAADAALGLRSDHPLAHRIHHLAPDVAEFGPAT